MNYCPVYSNGVTVAVSPTITRRCLSIKKYEETYTWHRECCSKKLGSCPWSTQHCCCHRPGRNSHLRHKKSEMEQCRRNSCRMKSQPSHNQWWNYMPDLSNTFLKLASCFCSNTHKHTLFLLLWSMTHANFRTVHYNVNAYHISTQQ